MCMRVEWVNDRMKCARALPLRDCHFYWTHRMLHTSWLYKNVHKEHHESFNPDPWSGLSMHWFESFVYFTSGPMLAPLVPLWVARLMMKGLLISPLEGHSGLGSFHVESTCNHHLHHSKFKVRAPAV